MNKLLLCLLAALAIPVYAAAADGSNAVPAEIRANISKSFPDVKVDDVRPSPLQGIYEVVMGADIAYVSGDGRFLIAGDLYEIGSRTNLTDSGRQKARLQALTKVDEREMIVFKPQTVKHTVTVFTDVECGYCRKLHGEISQLNAMGVQVRYLAYPRAGPGTDDWRKMEAVWCSKDRKTAITEAKAGRAVKAERCAAPIAKQFKLGEQLGVRGTPAIFTTSGDYIGGYLTPTQMVEELERLNASAKK